MRNIPSVASRAASLLLVAASWQGTTSPLTGVDAFALLSPQYGANCRSTGRRSSSVVMSVSPSSDVVLSSLQEDSQQASDATAALLKSVDLSSLKMPDMPAVPDMPTINLPAIDIPSSVALPSSMEGIMGDVPVELAVGTGVAVLAVLALSAASNGGSSSGSGDSGDSSRAVSSRRSAQTKQKKKSKPSSVLAIPYDAASRMAYETWCREHEAAVVREDAYAHFRDLYQSLAIAQATTKKLERDLQAFDNQPRAPVAPRQIAIPKPKPPRAVAVPTDETPFFAAVKQ